MLNEVASALFYVIQNLLQDEVQLALSKLTDRARTKTRTGSIEYLSLEQLQERVEAVGDKRLSDELRVILKKLKTECATCRIRRDKQLAHLDLDTSLQKISTVLPKVTIEMINSALGLVREYMNKLEAFYTESETAYEHFIMHSDGEALASMLSRGMRYEELQQTGQVSWDDFRQSKWYDA